MTSNALSPLTNRRPASSNHWEGAIHLSTKCSARNHLRGCAFALYDSACQLSAGSAQSGEARILRASVRTLVEMSSYSEDSITIARGRLIREGWLRPIMGDWIASQRRGGASGRFRPPEFEVIEHDTWAAQHPGKCPVGGGTVDGKYRHGGITAAVKPGNTATVKLGKPSTVNSATKPYEKPEDKPDAVGVFSSATERLAIVQRVFEYFIAEAGKNPKLYTLTAERKRMGLARAVYLFKRTKKGDKDANAKIEETMKACVDRMMNIPWYRGENDEH